MKSTFKIIFYLKRDKIKKNGKVPIFCRITIDKAATRFNLKVEIDEKLWNVDFGRAIGKFKETVDINKILDNTSASLHTIYQKILNKDNYVTAEKVKNSYLGLSTDSTALLQLYQQHNDDMEKAVGITVAKATLQKYQVTYKRLEEFMKFRYNISDINLKEIDHRFITDFELFLRTNSKCNINTTYKYMRFFKKIVIMARNNGWILTDPFGNYKIRYEKVDRGYLTDHELQLMIDKDYGIARLEQVRDVFIFCCYTGLAYVDVRKLTFDDIQVSFDGELWFIAKRKKTNVPFHVKLLPIAKQLIEQYRTVAKSNFVFPVPSNAENMNRCLRRIAKQCGISKRISSHLARHTMATTVCLSQGVPIETVSQMLGHSCITTTQIYAKITNDKISKDMALLTDKIGDKYQLETDRPQSDFRNIGKAGKKQKALLPEKKRISNSTIQ